MKKLIVIASLFIVIGLLGLSLNSSTNVNIINNHNKINTVSPDINNYNSLLSNKFYYEKSLNISGYYCNVIPYKDGFIYTNYISTSSANNVNIPINYYNFSTSSTITLYTIDTTLTISISDKIYNNFLFIASFYNFNGYNLEIYKLNLSSLSASVIHNYGVVGLYGSLSNYNGNTLSSFNISNIIILNYYVELFSNIVGNTCFVSGIYQTGYNLTSNTISSTNYYVYKDTYPNFYYNASYNIISNNNANTFTLLNLLNFKEYSVSVTSAQLYLSNVSINNNIEYINSSNYQIVFNFITNGITYKQLSGISNIGAYTVNYNLHSLIKNLTDKNQVTGYNNPTTSIFKNYINRYEYLPNGTLYIFYNNTNGINQIAIFTSQIYNLNITSINVQDGLQIGNYYYWNGVISSQSSYQFISIPSNPIIPLNYSGYIYKGSVVKLTAGDFHNGYYNLTFYYNSENVNIGYNFNDFYYPIMELGLVFLISSFLYMTTRYYKKDIQVMVI